jgi:hypothetical protein
LAKVAESSPDQQRRGPYIKLSREAAKTEIRRLIVQDNKTNQQISSELRIPLRSVERDVSQVYRRDNELLIQENNTQALTQLNIAIERLSLLVQTILEKVANAPADTPLKDKVAAWHLAGEVIATLKFTTEAPALMARRHLFPGALIDKAQSSGLTLVLKKQQPEEDKEKDVVYDELDLTRALTAEEIREDEHDEPRIQEPVKSQWQLEEELRRLD